MATASRTRDERGHTLRNWILVVLGAALVIGLVSFGINYGAEKNSSGSVGTGDPQLGAIATQVDAHAVDVRTHGERMIEIGQAEGQDLWIEQGTNLLAEARRLESAADQIRAIVRDKGILRGGSGVDIYRLRADGRTLQEAGEAIIEHGSAFAVTADEMIRQAQQLGSSELAHGAERMRLAADEMLAAGRGVVSAGQPLLNEADQLERSLGH